MRRFMWFFSSPLSLSLSLHFSPALPFFSHYRGKKMQLLCVIVARLLAKEEDGSELQLQQELTFFWRGQKQTKRCICASGLWSVLLGDGEQGRYSISQPATHQQNDGTNRSKTEGRD